jgi:hypothetical protein
MIKRGKICKLCALIKVFGSYNYRRLDSSTVDLAFLP